MLKSFVRGALVAAAIGAGFVGLDAAPASAAGVRVRVTVGDGLRAVPVQYRRNDVCRPRLALRKAGGMGLNRVRIVRENRRVVVVDGVRRGRTVTVRFANDRGCPVLAVRR